MPRIDVEHHTSHPRDGAAAAPERGARPARWSTDRIDGRTALVVGIAWLVLPQVAYVLEPETNHDVPTIAVALSLAIWVFVLATIAGLVARRRWGLLASLGGAAVFTAGVVACPITGHHAIGAWWFAQLVCAVGLVVVSVVALRRAPVSGGGEGREELSGPTA